MFQRVLETGEPHEDIGYPIPIPGKEDATWDRQIVRLPLSADEEPAALVLAWDSTAHHRLRQQLRSQEEQFRTLADNISQLAWMADPSGWIFWYNQRWFDYTGTALEDMQGWGWQAVHHPDHADRVVARFQQSLETGEPWEDTFPLRGRDGGYRWFLSRALPICDRRGAIVRWFGTNTDITEHLETEADLERRTVALSAANRELEAFAYSVSHDLRAPLRQMRMFGDLLLVDHGDELGSEVRGYLDRILGGAERMDRIIEDMLMLSRISRQEMERQPLDLGRMAETMLAELRERDPDRAVRWIIDPDLRAHGDPRLLHIALANLLGNAWKYTGRRAEALIHVGVEDCAGQRVFFVRDNGAGFAMDHAAGMFEPFTRLHSGEEFGGTGIGLAIVGRVIARHGGEVWAEGRPDHGATFFFTVG
ncbi:MAG: sensor histidine kinase [Planctomycetota bacterium]